MAAMPRQYRVEFPGAIYHLMSHGDRREDIFLNDVDRHGIPPVSSMGSLVSQNRAADCGSGSRSKPVRSHASACRPETHLTFLGTLSYSFLTQSACRTRRLPINSHQPELGTRRVKKRAPRLG